MSVVWIDAQLSPSLRQWLPEVLGRPVVPVRGLGLRDTDDADISQAGAANQAVTLTKDADFTLLVARFEPPPRINWLTCGNCSNASLRQIMVKHQDALRAWIEAPAHEQPLIEIR